MDIYSNPLCSRYASYEMQHIFSPDFKFKTWRKLWISLAKAQKDLGLEVITDEAIKEMEENINNIDYNKINEYESKLRHDVMANIYAFGDICPKARKIIHLGATSAFVVDNTDIIQIKEALLVIKKKLITLIDKLAKFSDKYKEVPTLAYTHFQAAQLSTVGKRSALWLQSLMYDFQELEHRLAALKFRGVKGTTGTQASFKELFNDYEKVNKLDELVSKYMNIDEKQSLSSQTYDRKQDSYILNFLSTVAETAHKITNDFRLLQHLKEIEEPFGKNQIGSSAMAYKRNPMRCERVSSLAKFVIANANNGALVSMSQWFERTLDDSANKRLSIPQSFLALDGILDLLLNIFENTVVYEKIINKNIMKELPFMATENIIMKLTKKGYDRQEVHEIIRELSMKAVKNVKIEGNENNLIELIKKEERLKLIHDEIDEILDPSNFTGYCPEQVSMYLKEVNEVLSKNKQYIIEGKTEINK